MLLMCIIEDSDKAFFRFGSLGVVVSSLMLRASAAAGRLMVDVDSMLMGAGSAQSARQIAKLSKEKYVIDLLVALWWPMNSNLKYKKYISF
jgi:hypothetical protein